MTDILNILFLIWLLISAMFIGLWWYRRRALTTDEGADPGQTDGEAVAPDPDGAITADTPADEEPHVTAEIPAGNAHNQLDDTDETGSDTIPADGDDPETEAAGSDQTAIDELLEGIHLPYELLPVTANVKDFDRHRIFISNHPDAGEVGTGFADELTRLGYAVEPAGFDEALATRGEESLSMRMVPGAANATEGVLPLYPAARGDDVALEVWLGRGRPPR